MSDPRDGVEVVQVGLPVEMGPYRRRARDTNDFLVPYACKWSGSTVVIVDC